ncbi:MAG: hypothetical protein ABH871_07505 [Pseudomonadota bacterium]
MAKKSLMVLAAFILFMTHGPAFAEAPKETVEPYVPQFSYAPNPQNAPDSAGVTFAVGMPSCFPSSVPNQLWINELKSTGKLDPASNKLFWFAFPQFVNLPFKMRRDVAELLYAKGFGIKGPYESSNAIPAADKKAIDLYLTPKINLTFTLRDVNKWLSGAENIEVNGAVGLEIRDMGSSELLWTKEVPLTKIELVWEMNRTYFVETKFNTIMNAVAKGIEQQYSAIMSGISNAIDPQEMRALKKSGEATRGKTGY